MLSISEAEIDWCLSILSDSVQWTVPAKHRSVLPLLLYKHLIPWFHHSVVGFSIMACYIPPLMCNLVHRRTRDTAAASQSNCRICKRLVNLVFQEKCVLCIVCLRPLHILYMYLLGFACVSPWMHGFACACTRARVCLWFLSDRTSWGTRRCCRLPVQWVWAAASLRLLEVKPHDCGL